MIPLRLVMDTNILVSAALKPDGLQRTVLVLAMTKPARLYVTPAILAEYREVLARSEFKIRRGLRQQLLQLLKSRAQLVSPAHALQVAKDPDDNKFLECADAARADYLITCNQRHFPKFWKQTKVITSREFISIVAPHFIQRRGAAGA
jgi:putative PIN family toxin of toxin-antitoxin system